MLLPPRRDAAWPLTPHWARKEPSRDKGGRANTRVEKEPRMKRGRDESNRFGPSTGHNEWESLALSQGRLSAAGGLPRRGYDHLYGCGRRHVSMWEGGIVISDPYHVYSSVTSWPTEGKIASAGGSYLSQLPKVINDEVVVAMA
jgi:hypothetical protein